jgi:Spy/CpxP family protein refolding chaperone
MVTFNPSLHHSGWFAVRGGNGCRPGLSSVLVVIRGHSSRRRAWAAWLAAVVCLLVLAPVAAAQSSPPLVDQYTEQVPTAGGPKHSGSAGGGPISGGGGGGGTSGSVLTPAQEAQITQEGGKDAKKLEELATSPAFGAPQSRPKADENAAVVKPEGALSAAVSAVGDGSDGRLIGLLVALVAITAAALGLAAARRQRSV